MIRPQQSKWPEACPYDEVSRRCVLARVHGYHYVYGRRRVMHGPDGVPSRNMSVFRTKPEYRFRTLGRARPRLFGTNRLPMAIFR